MPQKDDGQTIEPHVSEPMANDDETRRRRRRRSGGGAARPARRIPGILGGARRRGGRGVVAERAGQLDHRKLGDEDRARVVQASDDDRVVVDDLVLEEAAAPGRRSAPGGEQVLDAVRNSLKRPALLPGSEVLFDGVGLRERALPREVHDGVQLAALGLQARERRLRQRDRRELALLDQRCDVRDAREQGFFGSHFFATRGVKWMAGSLPIAISIWSSRSTLFWRREISRPSASLSFCSSGVSRLGRGGPRSALARDGPGRDRRGNRQEGFRERPARQSVGHGSASLIGPEFTKRSGPAFMATSRL